MSLDNVTPGSKAPDAFNVIIEIPMNADPIKYEVDKETGALFVDRFMTTAMHYPCNYGYEPQTLSDDGDPVDVLVITPYPLTPGVVVTCRPIGVLKMDDEAGGFVDHDQVIVFMNNVERDVFGLRLGRFRRRHGKGNHIPRRQFSRRFAGNCAIDPRPVRLDQPFEAAAGQVRRDDFRPFRQKSVEPGAGVLGCDLKGEIRHGGVRVLMVFGGHSRLLSSRPVFMLVDTKDQRRSPDEATRWAKGNCPMRVLHHPLR